MADPIRMRAHLKDGLTEVRTLIGHPMETGRRRDDFDEIVPAHFIQWVTVALNGTQVLEAQWGTGVSRNPYLVFRLRGAQVGDKLTLTWHDNRGETRSSEIPVEAG